MSELTVADLDQVEAEMRDAKASGDLASIKLAKAHCQAVRSAWRQQEEALGKRSMIGGDAIGGN